MSKDAKVILLIGGVISSIMILCCIGIAIFFYPPVFNSLYPNSVENKANKFLSSMSEKNYAEAFDLLTFELKDKVGAPENLPDYIGLTSTIHTFNKYRSLGLDFKTNEIGQIWKINFQDNSIEYLWMVFKDEYHDWKIDRFELHK